MSLLWIETRKRVAGTKKLDFSWTIFFFLPASPSRNKRPGRHTQEMRLYVLRHSFSISGSRRPRRHPINCHEENRSLRQHVSNLLTKAEAHIDLREALKNFPEDLRGSKPEGGPHTPWQLLEHIRIAQWDILEFSRSAKHKSPKWPDEYWPKTEAPPSDKAWDKSVKQVLADLEAMNKLIADPKRDLTAKIPHGDGQTLLREALLVADHNAYHLGQLVMVRRILERK